MKKASGILFTLLLVLSFVGLLPIPFIAPVMAQPDHVVINEFQAKGTEWIELYNPTASAVDTTGWKIGDPSANETLDGDHGITSIAAGGYVVINPVFDPSNAYDELFLYDAGDNLVDDVYYGCSNGLRTKGGCPVGGTGSDTGSSARAPNGVDTDDYAADWTIDLTATPGAANDAPAANLGGEDIIINEFLHQNSDASTNRTVELYNTGVTTVNLTYWWLTDDSDGYFNITTATYIAPGGFQIITTTLNPDGDILSLFTDTHVRADQLGIENSAPPDTPGQSYQRGPADGEGPNKGYDFASSGAPGNLQEFDETLNASNTPMWTLAIAIQLDDITVTATASWVWNVVVEDIYANPLPGCTVTAEYAVFNTTTYTTFPGSPVDQGDGNYTFTHDISAFAGSYHLRVNATKTGYTGDTVTVTLGVIGSETIIVRWDAAHSQYSGHLGSLVDGTQDVWRSFPNCILIENDQAFSASLFTTTDILIIPYIQAALTPTEMTALSNFLLAGGLIWWGGYYDMGYFNHTMNNEWISTYGFEYLNGTQLSDDRVNIMDPTNNTGQQYYPTFWTFPNVHPLLTGITELSISGTTQVDIAPAATGVTILATGDSFDTYWDADGSADNNIGDVNGTECVPLAVYEPATGGGALIVSGASNMLYEFDLDIGKMQFWRNMYDYRYAARLGISVALNVTSVNVDLAVSDTFAFSVTVSATGTSTLTNVQVSLTYPTELQLVTGTNPTNLGDIAPSGNAVAEFSFRATADGNYQVNVTISADGIPDIREPLTVSVSTTIITPPPFPIEWLLIIVAVIIIVIIIVLVICYMRRK